MATYGVFRDEDPATTVVLIAADLVGLTTPNSVGPLRSFVPDLLRPSVLTVLLQGAAGDTLPLEAFRDDECAASAADVFGKRIALEVAHAVADADPWAMEIDRSERGSVMPIALFPRRLAAEQPPKVGIAERTALAFLGELFA
jgi:hypothetical protein